MEEKNLTAAKLIRVFIAEEDTYNGEPLYKYILEWCLRNDIAGATVFKGMAGFGKHKKLRRHTLLPKKDLPLVVEIVDNPEKVESILIPFLKEVVKEGLITVETVYLVG